MNHFCCSCRSFHPFGHTQNCIFHRLQNHLKSFIKLVLSYLISISNGWCEINFPFEHSMHFNGLRANFLNLSKISDSEKRIEKYLDDMIQRVDKYTSEEDGTHFRFVLVYHILFWLK